MLAASYTATMRGTRGTAMAATMPASPATTHAVSQPLACDAGARAFAAVALVPAIPGKDLLTYRVSEADRHRVRCGVRVVVPIGRRRETGIVVELTDAAPDVANIRPIV